MVVEGMITDLIIAAGVLLGVFFVIQYTKTGKPLPEIRKLAGLEAIEEGIGRATEMSRPVFYLPGAGGPGAVQMLASMAILAETAKMTARYDTRLIVPVQHAIAYPMVQGVVKESYLVEGHLEKYRPDDVQWYSDHHHGSAIAIVGAMFREQPATVVMIGDFAFQSILFAEAASSAGAIQVAGTATMTSVPLLVAACDYCLIGEEMYAAAAYLTKEPARVGTILIEDYIKYFITALIVVGTLSVTLGSADWLKSLLSK